MEDNTDVTRFNEIRKWSTARFSAHLKSVDGHFTYSKKCDHRMKIAGAEKITLEDNHFIYDGIKYLYSEIASIKFSATVTRYSLNFIPMGKSFVGKLELWFYSGATLSIRPDTNLIGNMQERGLKALHQIKEILSEITFYQRLERYEKEFLSKDFFSYGKFQFHKSGDVFRSGLLRCSLRDPMLNCDISLTSLQIYKKKSGLKGALNLFGGNDETILIETDRDCFLYMMKNYFGLYWAGENVREKTFDKHKVFYESVVKLGALLATADGAVDVEEITQMKKFFKLDSSTFPQAAQLLNETLRSRPSVEAVIAPFKTAFTDAPQVCETLLVGMLSVALADGVLHSGELQVLRRIASALAISEAETKRIFASVGVDFAPETVGQSEKDRLMAVLGLNAQASYPEVVAAWRALIRRYHPDILRGQGIPEHEIMHSERLLVEINVAYEKLRKLMHP